MSTINRKTNIKEIASSLMTLKKQGQPLVLFMGARTGGLFGNADFYNITKKFSLLNFDKLSEGDKFQECYRVLSSKRSDGGNRFNASTIHKIFVESLKDLYYREENEFLARLVKMGLFDIILTTTIDSLLEDNFWRENGADACQVFIPGISSSVSTLSEVPGRTLVIKIFGDVQLLRFNTIEHEFNLEADQELKNYLMQQLSRNVLIIGYDPVWDQPVEQAFPFAGGKIWYVNEDTLAPETHLAQVVAQRKGQYLKGTLRHFWRVFYDCVKGNMQKEAHRLSSSEERAAERGSSTDLAAPVLRKKAFISYAHADSKYLDRFKVHLKAAFRDEQDWLTIWSDRDIQAGEPWRKKMEQALESASVAILLVSADFLASKPIRERGLPVLLQTSKEREVPLLSVILSPCAWNYTGLSHSQVENNPSEPLMGMAEQRQERIWADLAQQVRDLLAPQQ